MSQALSEDQRAAIRQMARDTADREGSLSDFDRDIVGKEAVQLRIPLRDTQEVRRHLDLLAAEVDRLRINLSYGVKDERLTLFGIRASLRTLNKKINAYRRIRPD